MSVVDSAKYTLGQCTAFVAGLFSWVPAGWGNAATWATNAAAQGYHVTGPATGTRPVEAVGDVAVWAPGVAGAHSVGHVAAVTSLLPGGGEVVQEENWTYGAYHTDTRTLTPGEASQLSYIAPPGGTAAPGQSGQAQPVAAAGATGAPVFDPLSPSDWVGEGAHLIAQMLGVPDISSPVPWFERNAVPLVTGVVIWLVLTGGKGPSSVVNIGGDLGKAAGTAAVLA